MSDVIAGMGHGDYAMSLRYTTANVERRRAGIDQMAALLAAEPDQQAEIQVKLETRQQTGIQAGNQAGIQHLEGQSGRRSSTTSAPLAIKTEVVQSATAIAEST
jgi:hypothetical protein